VSPTEILTTEHRLIEKVLTAIEEAVAKLERGQAVRPRFFLDAAEFVRGYCDGLHQRKEEGVLFPAMMAHGFPMTSGPLAAMLSEHEQARAHVRAMREGADALARGERAGAEVMVAGARAYTALVRQHIAKEERALFPMAESSIPAARHPALAADLARSSAERDNTIARFRALADALQGEMCN